MGNIKNIIMISLFYGHYLHSSDYYLFRFHPELPLHYRAELFLLDIRYKHAISNLAKNKDDEFTKIFNDMEYIVSRISGYKLAKWDYQIAINEYKNKMVALKK